MDYHNEIIDILEAMPQTTARITIKLGKRRDQLRHVETVLPPFSDGVIIDTLEEHGFGTSCPHSRLYFYDSEKNKLQTKSINQALIIEENKPSDISSMIDGILSTMAEMRRFVAVQNESIGTLVNRHADMMTNLYETKEEVMIERAAAIGLDMELQAVKEEVESSYKTQAIKAVSSAAQSFAENYQNKISPENLVELIMSNPDYIDHALNNEELTKIIAIKIAEKNLLK